MDPNPSDGRPFDLLHLDEPVTPELALRNVQLDVGSFLDDLVKPMLQKIQDANLLPPKLIDFINKELPVINKTPRELLTERMTDQQQKVFEFVFNLAGLIQQTDAQSGNLAIQFGDIVIAADADRPGQAMAAPVLSDDQVTTTAGTPGQEKMTDEDDPISIPGSGLPIVGPFLERLGDLGIFFPMLRLSNLSQLLVGNDIDLVLIDVPTLELTKEFDQSIPLLGASFGPVTVGATLDVSGGFELRVEIDGGIDTSGLRQGRFLDGFYLGDFEPGSNRQIDTTDSERREIELIGFVQAALTGSASVGEFELAEVSGYFRLEASLYADLNDDNAINGVVPTCDDRPPAERTDGKLHFGEAKTIVRSHGDQFLSILDIGGRVDAELGLHVTVLNGILFDRTYSFAFPIANFELTFDVNCPPELEGDEAFDDNVGPAGFQLDPLGNGVLRIDDLAPNVDADLDDVTVDTINQNGDLLDGNIIASFDVDELLFEQFGEDVIFELAIPELDLIDSNIVAGQALTWEQDNLPMTGIITNVTSNRFQVGSVRSVATALPAIPAIPAGAEPIRAISNVNVFSGNELTVVQAGGYLQYFGPELCGPAAAPESGDINRIDIVLERGDNTVTLSPSLTTPANVQFGAGNDRLFGGSGPLVAFGGAGRDVLLAGERTTRPGSVISSGNPSQLDGGSDSDILRGSLSADVLTGGEGDDLIFDGPARSQITFRASSQDHLVGGGGKDHIESRGGDDLLVGDYDEQIDRRPSDPGRQTESADTIKQSGIGRASVFGDNRAAADATVGVSPAANRDTADTIVTSDARTQVFAESGDSINSIQGTNDSVTVKISAEKQGVTVTPARIILQDQKPVLLGTRSHVTVTDSDGHVTIQGSKLNDFVTVAHAVEGLSIQFLGGGTVVVPGATTVQFFGNAGDDILTWQISSEATGLTRLDFDGEGGNAGDTLRLIGDDRTRIRASADVRTSIAGTLSNGETDVRFVNASTIDVSRLAALSWSTGGGADQYRLQAAQGPNQQPAMQMFGQADRIVHSSLLIHDVQDVLLDTSAGDAPSPAGDDAISVALDGLTARGLSTLTFSTGAGNDTLDVVAGSYTLPVAGGGLFFDGGTGIDRIVASADVNFTLSDLALTSSRGGAIRFANLVGEEARLTGGVGVNTFAIRDWSGNVSIDGDLGNDLLDLVLRGTTVTALESLTLASHVTVNSANRASVLRGPIELGSANRSFTVNDGSANADLIVESLLSGRVGIAKSGAGTMSLLTANSYTGTTDVTAGLLRVDGNQPQSRVTVRGTGILGGAGRVGSVTVSGGQLQPGSDVGRLTTAALNFIAPTPASTWQLNGTTAATSHDQIEVVGTVSLNGTLHVNPGFTPVVGDTFTIIANDGTDAIGGTFAGLPEGGTFTTNATTYRITYRGGTGNDVVLTAIANTAPRFPNRTITSPVAEGGLVTITGDISEPDPGDLFFLDVNWGDGSALETYTFQGSSPQASVTHRYADDSGSSATSYTVRLLWRDQHGAFNLGDLPVTILNRPPVIEPLADVTLEPGERFLLSGQFSDPGADRWTATVDYGDGAGRKILPLQDQQFTLINHYAQPGFYTVTVDVKDDDGGVSQESLLVRVWPSDVAQPGDANRDRQFSSADLTAIFLAGKYETNEAADWEEGDWNGDGLFNTRDLVLAMITGNYEQGRYAQRHANDRALSLFDVEPQVGSSIRSNTVDPLFAEAVADEDDFGWLI
jgi:autotransporter-associated beta strand protein